MKLFKDLRVELQESESWSDEDYERNAHRLPKHKYPIGHTLHHASKDSSVKGTQSGKVVGHGYRHGTPIYDLDNNHWVYEDEVHHAHK